MKKIALFALLCVAYLVPSGASAQEVTYVEDPSQGYLLNRMRDNWFIMADGGVGMMMSSYDKHEHFGHRLGAKADFFVGKWFTPILGLRAGMDFEQIKGATWTGNYAALGYRNWPRQLDGGKYVPQHFNNFGFVGDVLFNVSNWLAGYKPHRFYNCIWYVKLPLIVCVELAQPVRKEAVVKYSQSSGAFMVLTYALPSSMNLLVSLRMYEQIKCLVSLSG